MSAMTHPGQVLETIVSTVTGAASNGKTCFVASFTARPPR